MLTVHSIDLYSSESTFSDHPVDIIIFIKLLSICFYLKIHNSFIIKYIFIGEKCFIFFKDLFESYTCYLQYIYVHIKRIYTFNFLVKRWFLGSQLYYDYVHEYIRPYCLQMHMLINGKFTQITLHQIMNIIYNNNNKENKSKLAHFILYKIHI